MTMLIRQALTVAISLLLATSPNNGFSFIAGGGFVSTQSGRDTRLNGGQISGERVKVDVGRDLAVITPQAQGYREGFSFGLTIGFNTLGIRGSVEDGQKAWSAPSAIVGSKGLDIRGWAARRR